MVRITKRRWMEAGLGVALFASALAVTAQNRLTSFEYPVRPVPGVYYDGTQSGTGFTVDTVAISPTSDFVFSTYYHYNNTDGAATWMNLGAPLTQAPLAEYATTGISAYIRAQWLVPTGGQCFDCAYTAPAIANSAWGERQVNIVGARHLVLPASGNAAVRNMKLAKDLKPGLVFSQALLESGTVWQVKYRSASTSSPRAAWVRFRKRPTNETRLNFMAYDPSYPPLQFLDVPNLNSLQQYEAVAVRCWGGGQSAPPTVGSAVDCSSLAMADYAFDPNQNPFTFVVDASNDRVRMIQRCTTGNDCLPHLPSKILAVADVIEAGKDPEGADRLVIRNYALGAPASGQIPASAPGWFWEHELTRVSSMTLKEVWPNGVPWND